ncbi:MAG: hypothetical protein GF411_14835 [Candidatus Lokiarchaeota archaeon]|nr:hypothetical protein [Candidatus Lokiarchaeota archaeon]
MDEEDFINLEIINYIFNELDNKYDVELSQDRIWIYLDGVRVAFVAYNYFYTDLYAGRDYDPGLYFFSGFLEYDNDEPKKIEISNPNFISNIEKMIESKKVFLEADRNNRKHPDNPIIYRESDFEESRDE